MEGNNLAFTSIYQFRKNPEPESVDFIVYRCPKSCNGCRRLRISLTGEGGLLENGMAAALAVVLCCQETLAVVVIEDNVLAFVTDDILDAA